MVNEIIELFEKFSGHKLDRSDPIIDSSALSSVMRDRFISELKNRGIIWSGGKIKVSELINSDQIKVSDDNAKALLNIAPSKSSIKSRIGIDLQKISDMPTTNDFLSDAFYTEHFSLKELVYAISRKNPYETLAGIYSLKEAIYKADNFVDIKSIEISYNNHRPEYSDFLLSISHSHEYAMGVALLLKNIDPSQPENGRSTEINNLEVMLKDFISDRINEERRKQRASKRILWAFSLITFLVLIFMFLESLG